MLYLAIDQHRKQLTVNLRDEGGDVLLKRQVSTEWKKVEEFFTELARQAEKEGGFLAIVEVCGFNDWLLDVLRLYGCREIVLIQAEGRSKKKTDRRDANKLGELLWLNRDRLIDGKRPTGMRRVMPPTRQEAENRQITMLRKRLKDKCTAVINAVRKLLRKHNRERECPTKGIQTKKARRWLEELSLPPMDRLEMNLLLQQWAMLDGQLAVVEGIIEKRFEKDRTAQLLSSVPGVGTYGALAISSRIGDINRFARADSLANYFGITPGCRNSGQATQRLGSITKQGSKLVRFLLGQTVTSLLRADAAMCQWYKKIKRRRGAKIARVAVMRRLVTIFWRMIKDNRSYHIGGPPRRCPEFDRIFRQSA
jgi:transposase